MSIVLIIDDNPEQLAYWSRTLGECSADYSILQASSGQEGLGICRNQKVDCVVLDLDMPDLSGFEVLFTLITDRKHPSLPVIILTRLAYKDLHEMVIYHGAQSCLVKKRTSGPILDEAIQQAIASLAK